MSRSLPDASGGTNTGPGATLGSQTQTEGPQSPVISGAGHSEPDSQRFSTFTGDSPSRRTKKWPDIDWRFFKIGFRIWSQTDDHPLNRQQDAAERPPLITENQRRLDWLTSCCLARRTETQLADLVCFLLAGTLLTS